MLCVSEEIVRNPGNIICCQFLLPGDCQCVGEDILFRSAGVVQSSLKGGPSRHYVGGLSGPLLGQATPGFERKVLMVMKKARPFHFLAFISFWEGVDLFPTLGRFSMVIVAVSSTSVVMQSFFPSQSKTYLTRQSRSRNPFLSLSLSLSLSLFLSFSFFNCTATVFWKS